MDLFLMLVYNLYKTYMAEWARSLTFNYRYNTNDVRSCSDIDLKY